MRYLSDSTLPKGILPWQKLVMAYILGIWALKYPWPGLCALLLLFLFLPLKNHGQNVLAMGIFVCGFALCWFRLPDLPVHIPQEVKTTQRTLIMGQVESVAMLPGKRQRIILDNLTLGHEDEARSLEGKLVFTWQEAPVQVYPGQVVQANLNVRPIHGLANFGVWNSEFFWRTQNVLWRSYSRGEHFWFRVKGDPGYSSVMRGHLKDKARSGLSLDRIDPDRKTQVQGLGLALFFGDRYLVDQDVIDSIRLASLAHSLALSGLHLGIMAGMGFILAWLTGLLYPRIYLFLPFMKLGVLLAAPLCLIYIWMGQAPPTLIRSAIMFASWGLLLFLNQKRILLDGLFLAAAVITIYDPWSVFDLRLQLSMAAVTGIALVLPVLEQGLKKAKKVWESIILKYFLGLAAVTIAANIALLPVQAWTFNYVSPHLYLNLIWLPVLGFIVLPAGFGGIILSLVPGLQWLGSLLLALSGHTLHYFLVFLNYLDLKDLLHPMVTLRPSWHQNMAFWMIMLLIIFCRSLSLKNKRHLAGITLVFILAVLPLVANKHPEELKLKVLDVGQGQGVIMQLPGNKTILVDGGGSWNPDYDLGKLVIVPSLTWRQWPSRLEKTILSHAHVDHYGGLLYPLQYLGSDAFLHNGILPRGADRQRLETALNRRGTPQGIVARGDILKQAHGLIIEVLHPGSNPEHYDKLNDTSLVLRVTWKGKGMILIPGDIEEQAIDALLETGSDLSSKVLVVPHHGSRSSASRKFYKAVNPEIAVVSRGFMNRFDLPHQEVLDIISEMGIALYDTSRHGETVISWKSFDSDPLIVWAREKTGPKNIPYWF